MKYRQVSNAQRRDYVRQSGFCPQSLLQTLVNAFLQVGDPPKTFPSTQYALHEAQLKTSQKHTYKMSKLYIYIYIYTSIYQG
jgi:hypothetical protein